ncbi:MAG: oxygen-independent coproporphyrinogen III oxidase [Saprospiraceae bacterium]|nr:oxygen-independent coproporphyrinogen III oxidase [Saprospiraceae bacterium]
MKDRKTNHERISAHGKQGSCNNCGGCSCGSLGQSGAIDLSFDRVQQDEKSKNAYRLVDKYNVPGPRYTSYPTVPYWESQSLTRKDWHDSVLQSYAQHGLEEGISIYIHLPFCESLCTFCACHKRITKQHAVEVPYINTLLQEWNLYAALLGVQPRIKEIHLGGGTPTFFSPQNLDFLINGIAKSAHFDQEIAMSFEGHPNNTSKEHLQVLYDLGFRRTSFGIQDYDPLVQKTINRMQTFDQVKKVMGWARDIGYDSIGHDLVFGLPHQTEETMTRTMKLTRALNPDRIAFYSYAHVPWIKNVGQRGYSESDLPSAREKRRLYELGKFMLHQLEYVEIGMDHFAKRSDSLHQSMITGRLHRNFMGYAADKTSLMIGLGMSAISDSWYGFAQNLKSLESYTQMVQQGKMPIFRGHRLSPVDLIVRRHILNIMCDMQTTWEEDSTQFPQLHQCLDRLSELQADQLIEISKTGLKVTEQGRPFVRNVCMAFDLHLHEAKPEAQVFSMTV